jgi:hypothetical protein
MVLALICLTVSFGRLSSVVSESPVHKAPGCTIVVVGFFLVGNIRVFFLGIFFWSHNGHCPWEDVEKLIGRSLIGRFSQIWL